MTTNEMHDIQLACVTVADGLYAVDIMRIKEIIRLPRVAPLPGALPFVEGVINLRGEVITVVDLRKRLGLPPMDAPEQARLLILSLPGQRMGLIVDEVKEMITVAVRDLKPPPTGRGTVAAEHLLGLCLVGETPVLLLDIDSLLTFSDPSGDFPGDERL